MMNSTSNKLDYGWRRGVTLPELMVAVAITVGMLLLTGMVFKSATDASGQSMAYQEILQQARAVMQQLDQDFRGLRPDLPMAIVFEGYDERNYPNWGDPDEIDKVIRCDRIVFFANGDYQIQDHDNPIQTFSANVARIYYGQEADAVEMPESGSPDRRILFRRYKLLTANAAPVWNYTTTNNAIINDYYPVEPFTLSYWKNLDFINFSDNTGTYPGLFYENEDMSLIRRPDYQDIQDEIYNGRIGTDALQAMYLLPDVTDFRIDVWFANSAMQAWFPNENYLGQFDGLLNNLSPRHDGINQNVGDTNFSLYWNVAGAPDTPNIAQRNIGNSKIDWRPDAELQLVADAMAMIPPSSGGPYTFNVWPSALKFTFTLYDKGRRYFPEGVTFEYIVKLPPRS